MTTATAAIPATEVAIARRVDFPTWLPAMLVKELRQGLRARGFVGTLVAFQVIMTLFTIFAIAGGSGSESFNILQGAYWFMLNAQLLVITPGRALAGLQAEIDARSVDLLLLTRLTAWRVVLGKWISLLAQATLLVLAMLPYGVARYFFGSVDLAGEARLIALLFGASAVLTAAALWSSAMPKIGRVALGIALLFLWGQANLGSMATMMFSGRSMRGGGPMSGLTGPALWLVVFDAALVLLICLVGAVRKLAPRAESQAPLMRVLPLLAFLPAGFVGPRLGISQLITAGVMLAFVAVMELARAEEPMASHWRTWARRGWWGRVVGRFVQPGWASAMEWLLALAVIAIAGGLLSSHPAKTAHLAVLATQALVFPALLLTWMSAQFTQRTAGYILVLGGASLIAAVGAASASVYRMNQIADVTLLLLPISSFWSTLAARHSPSTPVLIAQLAMAGAVLGLAWWRARPYRLQRRQFGATSGEPDGVPAS